jgi:hypothetical protein
LVFVEGNPYGVFAFGIGRRISRGRPTRSVTLNAYVSFKAPNPSNPVPDIAINADRPFAVVPNVIATGGRPHVLAGEDPPPFSGLYPGAPVRVEGPPTGFGGVACFLGRGNEATHFLTAGHLFPPNAGGARVSAAIDGATTPTVVGTLAANLLDHGGTVDAAAVALTEDGLSIMRASHDGPRLTDVLAAPSVFVKPCRAFRPMTHDFSRSTQTGIAPTDAFLASEPRGSYWVRDAVATDGSITIVGDSGTILCTGVNNQFAMAMMVGDFHAHSIAEPLDRAIQQLAPALGNLRFVGNGSCQ